MNSLVELSSVVIRQKKELAEFFGFETRNKYEILDQNGNLLFYCAEMQKGLLGFILRQILGHWRKFEIHFFDSQKNVIWRAVHPFRFIFQRLDIFLKGSEALGSVEWTWGLFRKRYALHDHQTRKVMKIESGFLSFWTFPITHNGQEVAKIQKKWSGLLKEVFLDADNFLVEFSPGLSEREKMLILSSAILVDLTYFERKSGK